MSDVLLAQTRLCYPPCDFRREVGNTLVEQWGKYRLEHLIARGGMAEVFKASMVGPSGFVKPVCLKRVRSELSGDPEFVQMFESEARIAATLHHPNIVQVFDFDRHEGRLFLAMEYVDGYNLRQIIEKASKLGLRLPVQFAVHVLDGLLLALGHAHGRKVDLEPRPVIHRDVSPHNVIVSVDGVVKLADFGIAKAKGLSDATRQGVWKGKLAYTSPEQIACGSVDARTDLFCAGLVMWEMLSGKRLFSGADEKEIISQVLGLDVPKIPELSSAINDFVGRLLKSDPNDRFESAKQASEALARIGVQGCGFDSAGELVAKLIAFGDRPANSQPESRTDKLPNQPLSDEEDDASKDDATGVLKKEVGRRRTRMVLTALAGIASVSAVIAVAKLAAVWFGGAQEMERVEQKIEPTRATTQSADEEKAVAEPLVTLLMDSDTTDAGTEAEKSDAGVQGDTETRTAGSAGLLDMHVRPWANVKIDGISRGTTPITGLRLRAGSHRVVIENEELGYRESFAVKIRAGERSVLKKEIKAAPDKSPRSEAGR